MSPWEILSSPLAQTALGIAGDALKRAIEGGAEDPHAVANAELEAMREGLRAGIEKAWQAEADKKFGTE